MSEGSGWFSSCTEPCLFISPLGFRSPLLTKAYLITHVFSKEKNKKKKKKEERGKKTPKEKHLYGEGRVLMKKYFTPFSYNLRANSLELVLWLLKKPNKTSQLRPLKHFYF